MKNTSGFSVLVPDVVFGFSYFVLFWVPVSVRFEQHLITNNRKTPKLFRGMRDKINVMVGYQASPLTPGEPLTSQTRATICRVHTENCNHFSRTFQGLFKDHIIFSRTTY